MKTIQKNIINMIHNYLKNIDNENILYEINRDNKKRYEIPACYLYAKCKLDVLDDDIHDIKDILLNSINPEYMWDEYAYGFEDENIGYSGLVTTSYVLLSLVEYYKNFQDKEVLNILVKSADTIYFQENNGYIRKAKENKSDVLNTNLLAAMAIKKIAEILPTHSTRRRLYDELTRRVVRKVLSYQSIKGEFPYHFESKSIPILYQAMVTAQLRYLLNYYDDEIIHKSIIKGNKALMSYFKSDGYVEWNKANNHDKRGAMWVYSFSLAAIDNIELNQKILNILSIHNKNGIFHAQDNVEIEDKFFSAWIVFGLVWAMDKKCIKDSFSMITILKYIILKIEYFITYGKFFYKYLKNKIYNFPFNSGALENRYWCKK